MPFMLVDTGKVFTNWTLFCTGNPLPLLATHPSMHDHPTIAPDSCVHCKSLLQNTTANGIQHPVHHLSPITAVTWSVFLAPLGSFAELGPGPFHPRRSKQCSQALLPAWQPPAQLRGHETSAPGAPSAVCSLLLPSPAPLTHARLLDHEGHMGGGLLAGCTHPGSEETTPNKGRSQFQCFLSGCDLFT